MRTVKVPTAGNTRGSGKYKPVGGSRITLGIRPYGRPGITERRILRSGEQPGMPVPGLFSVSDNPEDPSRKAAFFPQYSSLIGEYN